MNQPALTDPQTGQQLETVEPLVPATERIELSFRVYRELQRKLDQLLPEALVKIEGKPFRTAAYWDAVVLALRVDLECIVDETQDSVNLLGLPEQLVRCTYRATLGSRSRTGDGAASTTERIVFRRDGNDQVVVSEDGKPVIDWPRTATRATYHNVRALAHTRGSNRAIAKLVAFGEVSAAEMHDPKTGEVF